MPLPLIPIAMSLAPLLGNLLSGGAKGSATERGNRNDYGLAQNQQALQQFNTQQNALLQSLLAGDRGATDRYQTQQGATTNAMQGLQGATTNALNSQSQEGLQRA